MLQAPIGLIAGVTYPLRALFLLIHNPKLRGYVIVPIVINFLVGIGLYLGLFLPGLAGINQLVAWLSAPLQQAIANLPYSLGLLTVISVLVDGLLTVVLGLVLFLLTGFLLVQFGFFLGLPWYGQLSEQIEQTATGSLPVTPAHPLAIVHDLWRAILFELKKLSLILGIGLPLFLLNLIPVVGTPLFSLSSVFLAATLVCLDFLDAPLERRRFSFRAKLNILKKSFPASMSFGFVCLALVSIPFLNLITIPICVAAGTLFFGDRIWSQLNLPPSP